MEASDLGSGNTGSRAVQALKVSQLYEGKGRAAEGVDWGAAGGRYTRDMFKPMTTEKF